MRCNLVAKDLMGAAKAVTKWLKMHRKVRTAAAAVVEGSIEETALPEGTTILDAGSQDTSHLSADPLFKETIRCHKDKASR